MNQHATTSSILGLADTTENIHIGLIGDLLASDQKQLVGKVEYMWGSNDIYAIDPSIYISSHLGMSWPHGGPNGENDESFAIWKAAHPDWVTYKCDKVTPAQVGNTAGLDFSNPAVQDYQFNHDFLSYMARGDNAIGFDNVILENWMGICGVYRNGQWVQLYSGNYVDPVYANAVVSWLRNMYTRIKQYSPTAGVAVNASFLGSPDSIQQLVPYTDIFLSEGGLTNYGGRNGGGNCVTDAKWLKQMQVIQSVQQQGKAVVLAAQEPEMMHSAISQKEIQWVLANYLLLKDHQTFTYVDVQPTAQDFNLFYDRPEYHAQIGHATNAMYQSQGLYMRDYSGGKAIVNPSSKQSFTVTLPANTYQDLYGNTIDAPVLMAPATGMVLLNLNLPIPTLPTNS